MEISAREGLKFIAEKIVNEDDTALKYGSGMMAVFATPALVGLMEKAAMMAVQKELPEGYLTVGTEINIRHFKATKKGRMVWAEAELIRSEGRKLHFYLSAWDEDGQIGSGTHNRYIVNEVEFMKKLDQ